MVTTAHHASDQQVVPAGSEATLPARFWEVATQRGAAVAMRWKHLGIWNDIRWSEYADAARAVGCALLAAGGRRGDRAAILCDARPEWCQVEFGALGVGVQSVGLFATDSASRLAQVVNDSAARWLFVQDQDQLDKALSVLGDMPGVEKIVYFDNSGLHALEHPQVLEFAAFLQTGRQFHAQHPARWESEVRAARPGDVATIVYTSGSEGAPKGVMLSHGNLMFQLRAMREVCPGQEGDEQLSFLSMGHIAERYFSVYRALDHGAVVHLGRGLPTLMENLREVSPHVVMAVPRVWEKLYASVTMAIADGTPLERWAYRQALACGHRVAEFRRARQPVPAGLAIRHALTRMLVLRRVLSMIGLQRARVLVSGAAPISPDLVRWFQALGLTMVEAYGQTECAGFATGSRPGEEKAGTVGKSLPGTEVELAADGEILVRGPHVFAGYLNQPALGARSLVGGWLHTGDLGRFDNDGYLTVTDRMGDTIVTGAGTRITSSEIEARLKGSPYIADAIVIGHGRSHLACLLMIDPESVTRHARERNLLFSGFSSLTRAPEVRQLIQHEIDRVNRDLGRAEALRSFELIDAVITANDPEMTPTLQLRRRLVLERYRVLVDAQYADVRA